MSRPRRASRRPRSRASSSAVLTECRSGSSGGGQRRLTPPSMSAFRWNGEGLDRLLDQAHAGLVEQLVVRLRAAGWVTDVGGAFSIRGERGSIDVLGFHEKTGIVLVIEVKSVVPDSQATLAGIDRKARLAF